MDATSSAALDDCQRLTDSLGLYSTNLGLTVSGHTSQGAAGSSWQLLVKAGIAALVAATPSSGDNGTPVASELDAPLSSTLPPAYRGPKDNRVKIAQPGEPIHRPGWASD